MTWEHVAVLAGAVALLIVGVEVVARRQRNRILATLAETEPEPVSTLPDVDPDGWSAQAGWSAWAVWLDLRQLATAPADVAAEPEIFTGLAAQYAPILAELVSRPSPLAIEPPPQRELEGATR